MKVRFLKAGPGYGYGYAAGEVGDLPAEAVGRLEKAGVVEKIAPAQTAKAEPETRESKSAPEKRTSKRGRPKSKD